MNSMAKEKIMALSGQSARNRKSNQPDTGRSYVFYSWLFLLVTVALTAIYVSIVSYREYIDPNRVYGEWTEIGAPSWSTDRFILGPDGVQQDNRYIATSFEFDGSIVSFYTGGTLYEYGIYGQNSERLKRMAGGGHAASFIKEGYEHTLPKEDNVGPARRVSLAEHFQSR